MRSFDGDCSLAFTVRVVDKVALCNLKLQLELEGMHNRFRSVHRNVNVIFAACNDALKGDIQVMNVQQSEVCDKSFSTCFQPVYHEPFRTVDARDLER